MLVTRYLAWYVSDPYNILEILNFDAICFKRDISYNYPNFSLEVPTDHSIMEGATITTIAGILMLVWMDGYAETTETVPGSIVT